MNIVEALEICITRHEIGRGCQNCRFKGEDCIKIHRSAIRKAQELEAYKKHVNQKEVRKWT